ncbi:MAG TPA: adenylate/guanylate cyclase domain-containing protein [Pyrinomonadaceae bacterium]|nr:adenylate/guanylate cyclase domain-containing protein [Pyrinomonadaceae bacterium]
MREFHYRWEFDLKSSPEQIWPLIADTNRFNRDTHVPSVETLASGQNLKNHRRRLRLSSFGIPIEWEEQPFEWARPKVFGVVRRYSRGPISELRVRVELTPIDDPPDEPPSPERKQTRLVYEVWAVPKNLLGRLAIPIQIGLISSGNFARAIREYDALANHGHIFANQSTDIEFVPGGRDRLLSSSERLATQIGDNDIVGLLVDHIENGDDFALARIRPYELAKQWQKPRRDVLETCLCATRAGILDLQWSLICPMCRGGGAASSLKEIASTVHCPSCNIDFTANFEQSVELTFQPNPSIREIDLELYCVGGPQVTPHIVAQQLLPAAANRALDLALEPGRYRVRTSSTPGWQHLRATNDVTDPITLRATSSGWLNEEVSVATQATINLDNATDDEQLFILERMAWSDDAATAAEVTALQMFRDLFATEALRPGEQISVGTLTVLFTDLKNSTRMYREIGDATAFGHVMNHFDVLKQVIAEEDGALVKTIGDAVMAVFRQPVSALKAMLHAQQRLASPTEGRQALSLKAGIHTGPCIAVTLNDRLDYFGSTVNLAARLEGQSTGCDIVLSNVVYSDPAVRQFLGDPESNLISTRFEIPLKGFDEESFELWRVSARTAVAAGT